MGREDQSLTSNPTLRMGAMPADTNPAGDICGGWRMSPMDLAAGNVAALTSGGRSAAIAADGMIFDHPVKVGDEVLLDARLGKVGRSSMSIHVDVWRRPRQVTNSEKVTEAISIFVALGENGQSIPVKTEAA
jgi:acyl-CoA thioesterase YciA